jgi:hypothetical protein
MSAELLLNLPWSDYIAGDALGSSALDAWGTCSLEAWSAEHLENRYDGAGSRWTAGGTYLDQLISGDVAKTFAVIPPTYTNEKGEVKPWRFGAKVTDAWKAEQIAAGREIIEQQQIDEATRAKAYVDQALKVMRQELGGELRFQATLRGEVEGLMLQTRPDMMLGNHLPDLKYINSMAFAKFARDFESSRYAIQTGLFYGLMLEATGEESSIWFILAESGTMYPRCRVEQVSRRIAVACWDRVRRICAEIQEAKNSPLGFVSHVEFSDLQLPTYAEMRLGL